MNSSASPSARTPAASATDLAANPATHAPSVTAWALGLAGLLPFVAGAALPWVMQPGWRMLAASALLTYAALIVSFLGGIHWGLTMRDGQPHKLLLMWGVVPSILGWFAVLLDSPWGLLLMVISLLACYLVDRMVYRHLGLSNWLGLRSLLTAVAVICCLIGGAAFLVL
jgi:hypothetical protein